MFDIDHLYDIVSKENPSKDEMYKMIEEVENANSFGSNSFSVDDLFLKMSQSEFADDKFIETMYLSQVENYRGTPEHNSKMLNNGSKQLFDKLWGDENTHGKWIKMWRSTHADTKQLETFWNDFVKAKKGVDKRWFQEIKNAFFRHPNAPTKILNRQLKNKESLLNIAQNPSIGDKALDAVASYAKVQRHDGIFENLLRNKGLSWRMISEAIDMKEQLKIAFGSGGFLSASARRQAAIFEFFRRKDTPESAKEVMYKLTGDEEFLPQTAKDIFLF